MTDKKLTWEEMRTNYPDQWIAIHNVEEDEDTYLTAGVVFCHEKDRKVFSKKLKEAERKLGLEKSYIAIRYTGTVQAPLRGFNEVEVTPLRKERIHEAGV